MITLAPHPILNCFPAINALDIDALRCSMLDRGQEVPILLFEDLVIDGRARLQVCEELGLAPKFQIFKGTNMDALKKISELHPLNKAQKAIVGARISTLYSRGMTQNKKLRFSAREVAKILGVYKTSISMAQQILKHGAFGLDSWVLSGASSLFKTHLVVMRFDREEQLDALDFELEKLKATPIRVKYNKTK